MKEVHCQCGLHQFFGKINFCLRRKPKTDYSIVEKEKCSHMTPDNEDQGFLAILHSENEKANTQ